MARNGAKFADEEIVCQQKKNPFRVSARAEEFREIADDRTY